MEILLVLAIVAILLLALTYSLCRAAALADLHSMRLYAAQPRKATDPWEEPVVSGGVYDVTRDGSGL